METSESGTLDDLKFCLHKRDLATTYYDVQFTQVFLKRGVNVNG